MATLVATVVTVWFGVVISRRTEEQRKKEERRQEHSQGTEPSDNRSGYLKEFFLANPTFVLSLTYLYVTAIGMLYSGVLYGNFGINILDYAEIADFLLAGFKNPFGLIMAGIQVALLVVFGALVRVKLYVAGVATGAILTFLILVTLTIPFANETASSIKHGEHPAVDVRYRSFSGSAGQVTEPDLSLIGATQKAVFFYDVNDKHTLVIPQSQIVAIEVPE